MSAHSTGSHGPGGAEVSPHLRALEWVPSEGTPDPLADLVLASTDLPALLAEVLDRVVRVLAADTAAVLLVDASGTELVARAARGLEEEVRQGVRVPIGHGFAGRVARERRALFLDLVDESTVANPILWRKGIRSMLGVPLLAGDQLVGVLHVGSLSPRPFDERDAEILSLIGDHLGGAVQVRLLEADRDAAEALQRSFVPSVPSTIAEFECAARYVPAERGGIGGDWYDLFQLESGDVWLVVGDVSGHGLRAAIVMGRIRSAIRSYALLGRGPHEVLELTDRKMAFFEVGHLATAAIAVFEPPFDHARVALAGHPPFALARPGEAAELLAVRPGPLLGLVGDRPPPTAVPFPPGAVLVGYTDGLVERRDESIDVGLERLRSSVVPERPTVLCDRVMSAAMEGHVSEDDVALITVRRRTGS